MRIINDVELGKKLSITNSFGKKNLFLIAMGWSVDISGLSAVTISNIFMSIENVNRKLCEKMFVLFV
jgi:hypothetical protein